MNWPERFSKRTARTRRSAVRELLKLAAQPGMISLAGGLPAPELFPLDAIAEATRSVLAREGAASLQYGQTEGVGGLRDWLAAAFSHPGRSFTRENVVVTCGGQQGLDLLGRVLLDEGDEVGVENPTYLAALMAWRPLGVEFVPLPGDECGLKTSELEAVMVRPPKMFYTVPNFQNPQGTTLTLERREELVRWASHHRVCLVEDNPYGELRFEGPELPNLLDLSQAMTGGSSVVYVGTFSKVLAPGLRVGWVIGDEELVDRLVRAKQAADLHTSTLCQYITLELLRTGCVEKQLPRLRAVYSERRDAMLTALETEPMLHFTRPRGGMFVFVTLPPGMESAALLPKAIERGVAFVPGEEFHVDGQGKNTLRLSYSSVTPAEIREGVGRLLAVLREG